MKLHEWQEKQKEYHSPQGGGTMFEYYEKDGKTIKKELFSQVAEQEAKKWASQRNRREEPELSHSQVRKFYNEIKAIERYIEMRGENAFEEKLAEIKMIKAKAAYAYGRKLQRKGGSITEEFKKFLDANIDQIKTLRDFRTFCKFFEAVLGFFEFYSASKVS